MIEVEQNKHAKHLLRDAQELGDGWLQAPDHQDMLVQLQALFSEVYFDALMAARFPIFLGQKLEGLDRQAGDGFVDKAYERGLMLSDGAAVPLLRRLRGISLDVLRELAIYCDCPKLAKMIDDLEPKPQKAPATPDAVEARQVTAPATSPTPVMEDSASEAPAWTVSKPQRLHGYSMPLYRLLAAAYREGKPRSTARDVVEAWRINKPTEVAKVLPDGFDYYDAQGNTKHADLEAIRKAIGRMISAR